MILEEQKRIKIKGLSFSRLRDTIEEENHYFGFDENNDTVIKIKESSQSVSLQKDTEDFMSFLFKAIEVLGILNWQWENISKEDVRESQDWVIILHLEDQEDLTFGRLRAIQIDSDETFQLLGVYSYPENFVEFIQVCQAYNFGPFELDESKSKTNTQFEYEFAERLFELEVSKSNFICPNCLVEYNKEQKSRLKPLNCAFCGHSIDENFEETQDYTQPNKNYFIH